MLGGGLLSVFSSVLVLLEFDGIEFPEGRVTGELVMMLMELWLEGDCC